MPRRIQEISRRAHGTKTGACSLSRHERASPLVDPKGPCGELVESTYGNVIASQCLQGKLKNMEVVDDFESRPHNAVTFLVARDKSFQELRELKMPKALLGCSGGKLPGRSKAEGGKECSVPSGAEVDEPLQTRKEGHERVRDSLKTTLNLEEGRLPDSNAKGWKVEGVIWKEYKRLRDKFEVEGFFVAGRFVEQCQNEDAGRQRSLAQG